MPTNSLPEPAAAHPPTERSVDRAVGLITGGPGQVGSTIYGTLIVLTATTAGYAAERHRPGHLMELVVAAVVVFWLAYVYAHALSESIEQGRSLTRETLIVVAHKESGMLLAAVPPVIALLLGALGILDESASIWIAIGLGILALILAGYRYSRIERLSIGLTMVIITVNVLIGLAVVLLKVSLVH